MKRYICLMICSAALGCSQDKPAQSAYNEEPAMTPASGPVADGTAPDSPERERSTSPGMLRADEPRNADGTAAPRKNDAATTTATTPAAAAPATPDNTKVGDRDRATAPDNTNVNERDRNDATKTPLDQGNNETDLQITQQIRKAVMADDSLSFTAKNVKIISTGGKVTLRGPVKTAAERNAIEEAARKVAGVLQVENQIEVKK